jgi:CheY-like chemotaxis protein
MRLKDMTVGDLRKAIRIYREGAYENDAPELPGTEGTDEDPIERTLSVFADETLREGNLATRRYALRLGNTDYPFMKLVLQEHLVEGEFFFEVDSHDGMFDPEGAEAKRMDKLRHRNRHVKKRIEDSWTESGLPTAATIKGLISTWPAARAKPSGRRILLVDDDEDISSTLALLLHARGFEVDTLTDGRMAVELADANRHDLILMDNEMKDLNGFEACRVLKSRPETRDIPVLIATAGALTLQQLDAADGFMVKPFRVELLISILEHMLGPL